MKKVFYIFAFAFSLSAFPVFSYEYASDAFVISGSSVRSLIDENCASVSGGVLKTVYDGREYTRNVKKCSQVHTGDELVDYFTEMALEETELNINKNGVFAAGANWPTAWTRDMSYAVSLSLSFLFPETVEKSLESRVENGFILQDTGSGGSYPVSTDRIVWGSAAYEYALVKQDDAYFQKVYNVITNTINYDYNVNYDSRFQLFRGETSFLDWREQTYPRWMDSIYIAESCALGTNVLYYSAMKNAASIAERFNRDEEALLWNSRAESLRNAIISHFWISEKKYFGAYLISNIDTVLYQGYETLGESLAVLYDVADNCDFLSIINAVKPGKLGMSVVAPQLSAVPSYHNDAVWPFVQGFRGLAAKKAGDAAVCENEFAAMLYCAAMFRSFKENYVASKCTEDTQTNSDRQLWSDAAFLAYIYRILCGIEPRSDGIAVSPLVFDSFTDGITAKGVSIGNTVLNLHISGNGGTVVSFMVNGKTVPNDYVIPYNSGTVSVEICVEKSQLYKNSYAAAKEKTFAFNADDVQPAVPLASVSMEKNKAFISWKQKNADGFTVMKDGAVFAKTTDRSITVRGGKNAAVYSVTAVSSDSVPVLPGTFVRVESAANTVLLEAENADVSGGFIAQEDSLDPVKAAVSYDLEKVVSNYGKYVKEWGAEEGDFITFTFNAKKDGLYAIDFRFKNGHGPVNTGEKCAVRAVLADGELVRRIAFPQQGGWASWAFSAPVTVRLSKGTHAITLASDSFCYTQHHKLNDIYVDLVRVSRIEPIESR